MGNQTPWNQRKPQGGGFWGQQRKSYDNQWGPPAPPVATAVPTAASPLQAKINSMQAARGYGVPGGQVGPPAPEMIQRLPHRPGATPPAQIQTLPNRPPQPSIGNYRSQVAGISPLSTGGGRAFGIPGAVSGLATALSGAGITPEKGWGDPNDANAVEAYRSKVAAARGVTMPPPPTMPETTVVGAPPSPYRPGGPVMGDTARALATRNNEIEAAMRAPRPPMPSAMDRTNADIAANNASVGLGTPYNGDPRVQQAMRNAAMRPYQLGSGGPGGGMEGSVFRPEAPNAGPQGAIAQSRFGGAMLGTDPRTGRAAFVEPGAARTPLDKERHAEAMAKIVPGYSANKPYEVRNASGQLMGQNGMPVAEPRSQQEALRDYFAKREEANLSVPDRYRTAPPPTAIAAAPPAPGTPAAPAANFAPPVPGLSPRDLVQQAAQQKAMERRGRLAARNAPPDPMMWMMQENPELAIQMAGLNQRGMLAQQQQALAERELGMRGDELAARRQFEQTQAGWQNDARTREDEWRKFAGQMERDRLERTPMPLTPKQQFVAAASSEGRDPMQAAMEFDLMNGTQPVSTTGEQGKMPQIPTMPPVPPGVSELTQQDMQAMVAMGPSEKREYLRNQKGITSAKRRSEILRALTGSTTASDYDPDGYGMADAAASLFPNPFWAIGSVRRAINTWGTDEPEYPTIPGWNTFFPRTRPIPK